MGTVPELSGPCRDRLLAVLVEAKGRGFLGPGPVEAHVTHSRAFVLAWSASAGGRPPGRLLDLGSGGGVPGLVLASSWPESSVVLLDGSVRRTAFLEWAVGHLDLDERANVVTARAEEAGHSPLRGAFDLVTARGFAPAAVTAECAAPLTRDGGYVIVAEPPAPSGRRWPLDSLRELGLELSVRIDDPVHLQVLQRNGAVPGRFPRRVGVPSKRPLWDEQPAEAAHP